MTQLENRRLVMAFILVFFLNGFADFSTVLCGQNLNSKALQKIEETDSGFFDSSILGQLGYRSHTAFVLANKKSLGLGLNQIRRFRQLDAERDRHFERLFAGKDGVEAQKTQQTQAEFGAKSEELLTSAQKNTAIKLVVREFVDMHGFVRAITLKPVVARLSLSKQQISTFLKTDEAHRAKNQLALTQFYKKLELETIESLNAEQRKTLANTLGFNPETRQDYSYIDTFAPEKEKIQTLLAGVSANGFMDGFESVIGFLVSNSTDYDLNKDQIRQLEKLLGDVNKKEISLLASPAFKELASPSPDVSDKKLLQLESEYQKKRSQLLFDVDQEAVKLLKASQLTKLKKDVFGFCVTLKTLSWILLQKPYSEDLKLSDKQEVQLGQIENRIQKGRESLVANHKKALEKAIVSQLSEKQRMIAKQLSIGIQIEK